MYNCVQLCLEHLDLTVQPVTHIIGKESHYNNAPYNTVYVHAMV